MLAFRRDVPDCVGPQVVPAGCPRPAGLHLCGVRRTAMLPSGAKLLHAITPARGVGMHQCFASRNSLDPSSCKHSPQWQATLVKFACNSLEAEY